MHDRASHGARRHYHRHMNSSFPPAPAALTMVMLFGLAFPAAAWEAGRDGALCTLSHAEAGGDILISFDPAGPTYTLSVRRAGIWSEGPFFGIGFLGGAEMTITTDRHTLSADGSTLSVTDSGFGNVLNGLSDNTAAMLFTSTPGFSVSLAGAAPAVAAFEACGTMPIS